MYFKYLPVIFVVVECLHQCMCEYRIEFLKACNDHQIQQTDCPAKTTTTVDVNSSRIVDPPSFSIGHAWHRHLQLIGNFTFHLGRRRLNMIQLDLVVQEVIKDTRCFAILQPLKSAYINVNCLRMVPSNFALIQVKFYQNRTVCTKKSIRCMRQLFQIDTHSFNIGEESCSYFNKNLGVSSIRRFTGWTKAQPKALEFQYFDSSINAFAAVTEIVITEMCLNRMNVVYNKTVFLEQSHSVMVQERCAISCPINGHHEIIAETCSYCHKSHEDTECFHQELMLTEKIMERSGCDGCSVNGECIHDQCVCQIGYHGDGHHCQLNHKDDFLKEIIIGAITGMFIIGCLLGIFMWIKSKKVKCKRLKLLFSPNEHLYQQDKTYNNEQQILIQNSQFPMPIANKKTILVLYHPDTDDHKQHVRKLVLDLRHKQYNVLGLPEDYQANWAEFTERVVQTLCDLVIVLSRDFCRLCKLYKNQRNNIRSEEHELQRLLGQRQHDCVPCQVMEKLRQRSENEAHEKLYVHVVQFGNESTECNFDNSMYNDFVKSYEFLRCRSPRHEIFHYRIKTTELMHDNNSILPLLSKLQAIPDNPS